MKLLPLVVLAILAVTGCKRQPKIGAEIGFLTVASPYTCLADLSNETYVASEIVIGPIVINCTNGAVMFGEGMTMDEASRLFWQGLTNQFPQNFPAIQPKSVKEAIGMAQTNWCDRISASEQEQAVKDLAAGGVSGRSARRDRETGGRDNDQLCKMPNMRKHCKMF